MAQGAYKVYINAACAYFSFRVDQLTVTMLASDGQIISTVQPRLEANQTFSLTIPEAYAGDAVRIVLQKKINESHIERDTLNYCARPPIRLVLHPERSKTLVNGQRQAMYIEFLSSLKGTYTGTLLQEGTVVDSFILQESQAAKVSIIPQAGASYTLRLNTDLPVQYDFPEIKEEGISVALDRGWIADQKVSGRLSSSADIAHAALVLHHQDGVKEVFEVQIREGSHRFELVLKEKYKGVYALSLVQDDGSTAFTRFLYFPAEESVQVVLIPDQDSLAKEEHLSLRIRCTDNSGNGIPSVFSIGVVQNDAYREDWVSSFPVYYEGGILSFPERIISHTGFGTDSLLTEQILYTHFDPGVPDPVQNTQKKPDPRLSGGLILEVFRKEHTYKGQLDYMLRYPDGTFYSLPAERSGQTLLPYSLLHTSYGRSIMLFPVQAGDKNTNGHEWRVQLTEPDMTVWDKMVVLPDYPEPHHDGTRMDGVQVATPGMELLEGVTVAAPRPEKPYKRKNPYAFGLARTLDPLFTVTFRVQKEDNTPGRYRLLGIDTFEYGGSSDTIRDYFHLVKGVWEANRFDAENPENGVQAGTTLYWNHLIITDEDGNATVKLNTGALPGTALIHLNGLHSKGAIHQKQRIYIVLSD